MTTGVHKGGTSLKKKKKEVQEEEKAERRHWGVGAGTGPKVYG